MATTAQIRIRGLRKTFGSQAVLTGVDLDMGSGHNTVLLGISGSGKTVLMRCILGLIEPDGGSIEIDGQETVGLSATRREALMRRFGVLFQNGALFDSLLVWQNVAFALINGRGVSAPRAKATAIETLAQVGLDADTAELYPADLSGGMQKRVALARAIIGAPQFLFLDDPTAGLDPIVTAHIDRLIIRSCERLGATTLTITHDLASARRIADRTAFLSEGRIAWTGPMTALYSSGDASLERFVQGSRRPVEYSPAGIERLTPATRA